METRRSWVQPLHSTVASSERDMYEVIERWENWEEGKDSDKGIKVNYNKSQLGKYLLTKFQDFHIFGHVSVHHYIDHCNIIRISCSVDLDNSIYDCCYEPLFTFIHSLSCTRYFHYWLKCSSWRSTCCSWLLPLFQYGRSPLHERGHPI